MARIFKETLAVILLPLGFGVPATAGSLEEGYAAYKQHHYAIAMCILRPSANKGNGLAATMVGLMYNLNYGVPRNYVTAYVWFNVAAKNGNSLGAYFLKTVASYMTPTQRAKAQRLAKGWKSLMGVRPSKNCHHRHYQRQRHRLMHAEDLSHESHPLSERGHLRGSQAQVLPLHSGQLSQASDFQQREPIEDGSIPAQFTKSWLVQPQSVEFLSRKLWQHNSSRG
ncbi:MAG TPA: hypothetical protein VME69_15955 [Methylocella sp.]|nr:hypothetical protein [Methylocella sp.]